MPLPGHRSVYRCLWTFRMSFVLSCIFGQDIEISKKGYFFQIPFVLRDSYFFITSPYLISRRNLTNRRRKRRRMRALLKTRSSDWGQARSATPFSCVNKKTTMTPTCTRKTKKRSRRSTVISKANTACSAAAPKLGAARGKGHNDLRHGWGGCGASHRECAAGWWWPCARFWCHGSDGVEGVILVRNQKLVRICGPQRKK